MYSRLDSLFRTSFRHAETADARMGIRREEGQNARKKKHQKKEKEPDSLWEDSASVSVPALKAFLKSLIRDNVEKAAEEPASEEAEEPGGSALERKASGEAAKAARAYQTTARTVHHEDETLPPVEIKEDREAEAVDLSAEEQEVIRQLLADIDILSKQGIDHINIRIAGSFLESLVHAVRKAGSE